jgi:hypothetical protein
MANIQGDLTDGMNTLYNHFGEFCISEGLTEDERSAASAAFAPFMEIHKPGARH